MTEFSLLKALQEKHFNISKKIEYASAHHFSVESITKLKKQKLQIKDKISKLTNSFI